MIFKLECENILRYCIHCLVAVLASVVVRCAVVSSSGVMAFVMVWVALLLLQYGATEVEDLLPNLQFYSTPRPFPSRRETSLKCRENKRNLCQQVKVFLHYIHKRKMNICGKLQNGKFYFTLLEFKVWLNRLINVAGGKPVWYKLSSPMG